MDNLFLLIFSYFIKTQNETKLSIFKQKLLNLPSNILGWPRYPVVLFSPVCLLAIILLANTKSVHLDLRSRYSHGKQAFFITQESSRTAALRINACESLAVWLAGQPSDLTIIASMRVRGLDVSRPLPINCENTRDKMGERELLYFAATFALLSS